MAQKGKNNSDGMMNPEKYIRTRARSLPVHECFINPEWKDGSLANIVITRRHTNGNFTLCLYLADLFCQGVKDTYWYFNITSTEYDDLKKTLSGHDNMQSISYELAHNIIFAAVEFAEEWGFDSHRDFSNVTKYMLEEDSEKIELIDIECGVDGKPAFMIYPDQDRAEADRIISKLEKNAGPGNYVIIDGSDEDDSEEDESDNHVPENSDEDDNDDLAGMTMDEKVSLFFRLFNNPEEAEDEENKLGRLMRMLLNDLCDEDQVESFVEEFRKELNIPICPFNKVPPELLGLTDNSGNDDSFMKKAFLDTYQAIITNRQKARKKLNWFRSEIASELPASDYLELLFLQLTSDAGIELKITEYAGLHPDYSLIKLIVSHHNILSGQDSEFHNFDYFFPGRIELHRIEVFNYLNYLILAVNKEKNPHKIKALRDFLIEYNKISLNDRFSLLRGLFIVNLNFLKSYFESRLHSNPDAENLQE